MLAPAAPADVILAFLEGQQALAGAGGDLDARVAAMAGALRENQRLVADVAGAMRREVAEVHDALDRRERIEIDRATATFQMIQELRRSLRGEPLAPPPPAPMLPLSELDALIDEIHNFKEDFGCEPSENKCMEWMGEIHKWFKRLTTNPYQPTPLFSEKDIKRGNLTPEQETLVRNEPYGKRLLAVHRRLKVKLPRYDLSGRREAEIRSYFFTAEDFREACSIAGRSVLIKTAPAKKRIKEQVLAEFLTFVRKQYYILGDAKDTIDFPYSVLWQGGYRDLWLNRLAVQRNEYPITATLYEASTRRHTKQTMKTTSANKGLLELHYAAMLGIGHLELKFEGGTLTLSFSFVGAPDVAIPEGMTGITHSYPLYAAPHDDLTVLPEFSINSDEHEVFFTEVREKYERRSTLLLREITRRQNEDAEFLRLKAEAEAETASLLQLLHHFEFQTHQVVAAIFLTGGLFS